MIRDKVLVASVYAGTSARATRYYLSSNKQFDVDWHIGKEEALRWFARARLSDNKVSDLKPCGQPTYETRRKKRISRQEYLAWAYQATHKTETTACYLTPNLFFDWRNTQNIKGLTAHWLEIDTAGHTPLTAIQSWEIYQQIADCLGASNLPAPTNWVLTGSGGVHLYWRYDQPELVQNKTHRFTLLKRWKDIAAKLGKKLETWRIKLGYNDWKVDHGASNDPSRLMRMPGSQHNKTAREVLYLTGGPVTSLQMLGKKLGFKVPITTDAATAPPSKAMKAHHIRTPKVCTSIARDPAADKLAKLAKDWEVYLHRHGQVVKGKRDLTLFHLYNIYRRIMAPQTAWDKIIQINDKYIGFTGQQLSAYLSSSIKTVYRYTLKRLNDILTDELELPLSVQLKSREKLSPAEQQRRQSISAKKVSKARASTTLNTLVELVLRLCKAGYTLTSLTPNVLLNHCQISRATIYRHWNKVIKTVQQRRPIQLKELLKAQHYSSHSLGFFITPPKSRSGNNVLKEPAQQSSVNLLSVHCDIPIPDI
ncbi:hypothetical protein J8Z24_21745 (plasmid) [Pseudoalteromonas sp. SCSIO 43201]|uniref:hypothetical protein n=1 Tax=Pseudoalteromonas sp. SCSIO 43201 TaxID=2822842 RepID=UPI00207528B3|nr:hypothetical protein [Pseudoalteromonas sp. SCSIO 43201]USD31136.1 hypothetical protein J8Z24_21745 [Pseudoalteromonas sp. SCSIO 43201]